MYEYSDEELDILGLQIGCIIRLERLKKGLSQEVLGLLIGSNKTTIGRLERYENATSWKILFKVCQSLKIDYKELFLLQPIEFLLSVIKESFSLEEKLTVEKEEFYINLETEIKKRYLKIKL